MRKKNEIVDYDRVINLFDYDPSSGVFTYKINRLRNREQWREYISVNKRMLHLGNYNSFEEARDARKLAETKYFGGIFDDSIIG